MKEPFYLGFQIRVPDFPDSGRIDMEDGTGVCGSQPRYAETSRKITKVPELSLPVGTSILVNPTWID